MMTGVKICKPVLLVEGDGDMAAVPALIRRLKDALQIFTLAPCANPIKCGEIASLKRKGELEKFAQYACRRPEATSALIVIDCDDDCPVEISQEFASRLLPIAERYDKRIGLALLQKEFETLFLYSLPELCKAYPAYGWQVSRADETKDWSALRGAKGELNRRMNNYFYKETRDQVRFVSALDPGQLEHKCRSFLHLKTLLQWMVTDGSEGMVYPPLRMES